MAGPLDFSQDGAVGAGGGVGALPPDLGGTAGSSGTLTPPTMSDPGGGPTPPKMSDPGSSATGSLPYGPGKTVGDPWSQAWASSGGWIQDPATGQFYQQSDPTHKEKATPTFPSFAEGGLVPDADGDNDGDSAGDWQSMINDAISTVNNALSYGYQLHGLTTPNSGLPAGQNDTAAGSAGAASPKYQDFNKSPDVEDRRNNPPMSGVSQAVNNFEGKAYNLAQRAIPLSDQSDNPLSQDAGINDVGSDQQQGAIPDEEQ